MRHSFDKLLAGLAAALAFALYAATLLPGLGSGDTAEFQRVLPALGVAHPTGYPLYTLLGWLWALLPLGGTPAWRVNLFSATAAALAVGALYLAARAIGQSRGAALAAALALATSRTFWSQATIAEVYALACLLQALLLLALLRWRAGRWPLWPAGLLLGLGLAHHRTIVLMLPGALVFLLASAWRPRVEAGGWATPSRTADGQRSILPPSSSTPQLGTIGAKQLGLALAAGLLGPLLYLSLPLREPAWFPTWRDLASYVGGSDALATWLVADAPWRRLAEQLRELLAQQVWPQLTPAGALLAAIGLLALLWRDRALAGLLGLGYFVTLGFCTLFFVRDVEVFLLPAHLIAALLLGEGITLVLVLINATLLLARRTSPPRPLPYQGRGSRFGVDVQSLRDRTSTPNIWGYTVLAALALLLPALLAWRNLPAIRAANRATPELAARALLAQDLPPGALLIVDWDAVEGLRYLQAIERLRPDLEVRPLNASVLRQDVDAALAAGRATFLLSAQPELGLAQEPAGRLWRVRDQPLQLVAATPAQAEWQDGLTLTGFTLPASRFRPGEIVPVTLAWRARATPSQAYILFVHIVGPDGALWGQHDRPPAGQPTDQWPPGAQAIDLLGPALRVDAPPGRYRVLVGWYSYPSLARLPLAGGRDALDLGTIEVEPLP